MPSEHCVSIHALHAGYLTLPEAFFVTPLEDKAARTTVPSLSFLIQHQDRVSGKVTRIVFDLGIRRVLSDYAKPLHDHAMTRQPLSGDPDTIASLAAGGLSPDDIDFVFFSHLHWDHIGTPSDYPNVTYVIGNGAASLIDGTRQMSNGSHSHFEKGILDFSRTIELPSMSSPTPTTATATTTPPPPPSDILETTLCKSHDVFSKPWRAKGRFQHTMDIFGDGSVFIVSAPGHLDGHINLLCRKSQNEYVYLAGDACHDPRLLSGEKNMATWSDPLYPNVTCCIHSNKALAEKTLAAIRATMEDPGEFGNVEVIFAHDAAWEREAVKLGKFLPGSL